MVALKLIITLSLLFIFFKLFPYFNISHGTLQVMEFTSQRSPAQSIFTIQIRNPVQSKWRQRVEKVSDYCKNHNFELSNLFQLKKRDFSQAKRQESYQNSLTHNIVYVWGLALNWCPVPKVASTSLATLLAPYLKKPDKKLPKRIHGEVWGRAGHLTYSDYVRQSFDRIPSFLVVRHPFSRIVSAYKNRLENKTRSDVVYKRWSKRIME